MVRQENRDGYIDTLMQKEDYGTLGFQGKLLNGNEQVFFKPYMFIEKEGSPDYSPKTGLKG